MHSLNLPGATIQLYESSKHMPASLYQTAKQYEVMAAELGQSEAERDKMLVRADEYVRAGKLEDASDQINNYRIARALALGKFQSGQLEWACYVHSVNDVLITDYSENNLLKLIQEWSTLGLTQLLVEQTLDDVKKNSLES